MAKGLTVKYLKHDDVGHTWEVFQDNKQVGCVHYHSDGSFGGTFPNAENCEQEVWNELQDECMRYLADLDFIKEMEQRGY